MADQDNTEHVETGNTEAKRYRLRLREVEAERDDLAAKLSTARTAELDRLAGSKLADEQGPEYALRDSEDLLRYTGHDVDHYLTEDGQIDADAVTADLRALHGERPHLFAVDPVGPYVPDQGNGGLEMPPPKDQFKDAFAHRE
jgi:hypothetical protein